jgi:hypothetical protein
MQGRVMELSLESYEVEGDAAYRGNRMGEARDKLLEAIEEVLNFSDVVLNFLEINTGFRRKSILEDPGVFCRELEDLFGAGAYGIERLIVERFYSKMNLKYVKDRKKTFADYISEAVKLYLD